MPLKIKDVLKPDIDSGYITWSKIEMKAWAALDALKANFHSIKVDGTMQELKSEDALYFSFKHPKYGKCWIKIFYPRAKLGVLYCSGIQYGIYDDLGKKIAISPYKEF